MREIKFRLWQDGKMTVLEYMYIGVGQLGFSDTHYIDLNDMDHENVEVMQYTGLKDENGTEIYEGDIVKFESSQEMHKVKYWDGSYRIGPDFLSPYVQYCAVIGNIYANPELLK